MTLTGLITALSIFLGGYSLHNFDAENNCQKTIGLSVNNFVNYQHFYNSNNDYSRMIFLNVTYRKDSIIQPGLWVGAVSGYTDDPVAFVLPVLRIDLDFLQINISCMTDFSTYNRLVCATVFEKEIF